MDGSWKHELQFLFYEEVRSTMFSFMNFDQPSEARFKKELNKRNNRKDVLKIKKKIDPKQTRKRIEVKSKSLITS